MTETTLDKICSAIDLITERKIQGLEFDRTISATIINADNSKDGEYTVSDGSSSFLAYSENTNYKVDEQVYVTVPNNNFNEQKWITGRRADDNNKEITYIPPFDQYFDLTGNLFEDNEFALNGDGLLANNPNPNNLKNDIVVNRNGFYTIYRPIGDAIDINEGIAYERLGIKADFKSLIPTAIDGNYGLEVRFFAIRPMIADSNRYEQLSYSIRLDSKDMWGNPYNFANYFEQQLIYDISEIGMITQMRLYFYQEGNFINHEKEPLEYTIPGTDELLPDNLFIKNIYVSLGNSIEKEEKVVLYTTNSLTYKNSYNTSQNTKKLKIRWAHLFEENTCVAITKPEDIEKYFDTTSTGVNIRWYQYDKESNDELAGVYWKQIKIGQDFYYTFLPDFDKEFESFKVIIELVDKDGLKTYNQNVEVLKEEKRVQLNNLRAEMTKILDQIDYYKKKNKYNDKVTGLYDQNITDLQNEFEQKEKEAQKIQKQIDKIVLDTSGFYTYLKSDIVTFRNDADNLNPVEEDTIKGLTLKCDEDGVFRLYSTLTNDLVTNADQYKDRVVTLNFESVLTQEKNAGISEVRWYIPKNSTMVQKPLLGINYFNNEDEFFYKDNDEYPNHYKIVRVNPTIENVEGDTYTHRICNTTQSFRIKSHLMQSLTNNTIYCVIVKDKKEYPAAKLDLVFGPVGTSGTNNTLIIELEKEVETNSGLIEIKPPAWTINETKKLLFSVHLYDEQDNEVVENIKSYKWELMYKNVPFGISGNGVEATLIATNDNIYSGCIVKCTVTVQTKIGENDGTATKYVAYYPLGVRSSKLVKNFIGADRIIYDNGGSHPTFYKTPYSVTDGETLITDDIKLYYNISGNSFEVNASPVKQYLPQLNNSILRPKSLYMNDIDYNLHIHISNKWIQPILVLCNTYGSILLNEWDGSFQMDTDEGIILSTMLGAGRKNSANQFEGVLMGDVRKGTGDNAIDKVGLYGYQDGVQSFGFKVDGTAFIGKSSGARLEFDGNTGTIQNAGYTLGRGMLIDFNGTTGRQGCFIDMQNQIPMYSIATINSSNTSTYFYRPGVVYYSDSECKNEANARVNNVTLPYLTGIFSYGYLPNGNANYDASRTYYLQDYDLNGKLYYAKVKEILQERDWKPEYYIRHTALIDTYYEGLVYYANAEKTQLAKGKLTEDDYKAGVANGEKYYNYVIPVATVYESNTEYIDENGNPSTGSINASNIDEFISKNGSIWRVNGTLATDPFDPNAMYFEDQECKRVVSWVPIKAVVKANYFVTGDTYYVDINKSAIATGRITHESYEPNKYYTSSLLGYKISNINKEDYTSLSNYYAEIDNKTFYTKLEDGSYVLAQGPITYTNFSEQELYTDGTLYQTLDESNYSYGTYYLWGTDNSGIYVDGYTYYSSQPHPPVFTQVTLNDSYNHQLDYYNSNKEKITINENLFNSNKTDYYYYKYDNDQYIARGRVTPENFGEEVRYLKKGEYLLSVSFTYNEDYYTKNDDETYRPALSNITEYNFIPNQFYAEYGTLPGSYIGGLHYYNAITCLDATEVFSNFVDTNKTQYYYGVSKVVEDGDQYDSNLEYYMDATRTEVAKLYITSYDTFNVVLSQLGTLYTYIGKSASGTTYSIDRTYYKDIYCIDQPTDDNGNTINIDQSNYQNYYYTEITEDKKSQVLISTISPYFKVKDRNGYDLICIDKDKSRLAGWTIDKDYMYSSPIEGADDSRDRGRFYLFAQDPKWSNSQWNGQRGIKWYNNGNDISDNWRLKINDQIGFTWDGRSFLPYIYCAKLVCEYEWTDKDGKVHGPEIVSDYMETHQLEVYDWSNIIAANSPHGNLDEYIKWMAEQNFKKGKVAGMKEGLKSAKISLSRDGTVTVTNSYTSKSHQFYGNSYNNGYNFGYAAGKRAAKPSSGGGCFEQGTLITLSDGTTIPIENIKIGDKVISYNELTSEFEISEVTDTIVWHNTINMVKLYFEDGNTLIMTTCHPILTTEGWKSLDHKAALKEHLIYTEDIEVGQKVITKTDNIKIIHIEYLEDIPNHDTYNITVPKNNTYLANGFVVHNALIKNA